MRKVDSDMFLGGNRNGPDEKKDRTGGCCTGSTVVLVARLVVRRAYTREKISIVTTTS